MTVAFFLCMFVCFSFFFFNDTATTEIYTLSLHDALPISRAQDRRALPRAARAARGTGRTPGTPRPPWRPRARRRSEEHTSELQSRLHLVCRLLLEKKKTEERNAEHAETQHSYGPIPTHVH